MRRRYDQRDEERLRLRRLVDEWTRAGLLDADQGQRLGAELRVSLRCTGIMLRVGLAMFTAVVVTASVGLVVVLLDIDSQRATATTCAVAGSGCLLAAERLAVRFRFYRHGVEEMLAVAACVLFAVAAGAFTSTLSSLRQLPFIAALVTGSSSSYVVYRAFGLRYAAIGSLVCLAAIPFQLDVSEALQRLLSASVLVCAFVITHSARRRAPTEMAAEDVALVHAGAFAGMYLVANLYVTGGLATAAGWFRWTTYAATWILPVIGVWLGIRDRDRWLLDVGIIAALATLVSNKPYLGLLPRPWDAMLLGALLIGVALGIRRWLARSTNGERAGFTPQQILPGEQELIRLSQLASTTVDPRALAPAEPPHSSAFRGGRSGGGGGGADF